MDWHNTYKTLSGIYEKADRKYRFNAILAPLGGKMQTVGAWYFAVRNPEVKVVTSTPDSYFPGKYSIGFTQTHTFPWISIALGATAPERQPRGPGLIRGGEQGIDDGPEEVSTSPP